MAQAPDPQARTPDVRLRRIYDEPAEDDGMRVLVDRRWPRGVSKERASALRHLRLLASHGRMNGC
ncbi:MAG TPA: DUF488 family protein [Actinomycetales bacterium]|nr:DUF488 family protein [Actinomycetales bacterium]